MLNRKAWLLVLFLVLLVDFPHLALAWSGRVVGIADGDTITVLRDNEQVRIRLYGIDTPERRQAFGNKAKQFTSDMVFGKVVEVDHIDTDRYGRLVALVRVDGALVNSALVQEGLARVYQYYCTLPFCEEGSSCNSRPRMQSEGFGLTRTPFRLGSLEKRRGVSETKLPKI